MITKTKLWNLISTELKTIKRLDEITETVMKKIKELETNNVENTNVTVTVLFISPATAVSANVILANCGGKEPAIVKLEAETT